MQSPFCALEFLLSSIKTKKGMNRKPYILLFPWGGCTFADLYRKMLLLFVAIFDLMQELDSG